MKKLVFILCLALITQFESLAQSELVLKPYQGMCITGKGPGQDGAINPFDGQNCYAIVKNVGNIEFSIRTQQKGKIIATIPIKKGETKKVKLFAGNELYFDSVSEGKAKATVDFEKMDQY